MSSHAYLEGLLATYRDLTEAERQQIDQHIQTCPDCATRLAEYNSMDRAVAHLAAPRPEVWLRQEFYGALDTQTWTSNWRRMLPQRFAAVAVPVFQVAAVVLLIVVSWLVVQGELGSSQPTSGRFPTLGLLPSQEETRSTYLLANESNLTHDLNRALVNRFKTLHPEFKQLQVDFSSRPFEQALSAAPPADVLIWHADNSLPALVEKGMILNIDDTWLAEGWSESYPDYI
jgi:hypothetical protein